MRRRQLLAGAAALPLAGMAVDVQGSNVYSSAASDDPAVRAFHVWRAAWKADHDFVYSSDDCDHDPEHIRLHDAEWEARKALAETVATTPAGIACQLRLALDTFGEFQPGADFDDPESYAFYEWGDELDGQLMRNMLAGAERLA